MTVIQGLNRLRLGLPLALLELVPQLGIADVMECVAAHNTGKIETHTGHSPFA